jgi:hypothetical protein
VLAPVFLDWLSLVLIRILAVIEYVEFRAQEIGATFTEISTLLFVKLFLV